jgi:hypothetical protein
MQDRSMPEIWFRRSREGLIQWPRPIHWKGWVLAVGAPLAAIIAGVMSVPYAGDQRWLILIVVAALGIWLRSVIDRHSAPR